jgi:DNA-binding response OmpR family regulator
MLKKKILIIDDEADYCMIMKSYFTRKGYDVTLAATLKEGMKQLTDLHPDILFLDNNLPDGKGWLLLDDITNSRPDLKIFLVSAFRQEFESIMPTEQVTIWEKPISFSHLNSVFA